MTLIGFYLWTTNSKRYYLQDVDIAKGVHAKVITSGHIMMHPQGSHGTMLFFNFKAKKFIKKNAKKWISFPLQILAPALKEIAESTQQVTRYSRYYGSMHTDQLLSECNSIHLHLMSMSSSSHKSVTEVNMGLQFLAFFGFLNFLSGRIFL